jgi:hypothetical protein
MNFTKQYDVFKYILWIYKQIAKQLTLSPRILKITLKDQVKLQCIKHHIAEAACVLVLFNKIF